MAQAQSPGSHELDRSGSAPLRLVRFSHAFTRPIAPPVNVRNITETATARQTTATRTTPDTPSRLAREAGGGYRTEGPRSKVVGWGSAAPHVWKTTHQVALMVLSHSGTIAQLCQTILNLVGTGCTWSGGLGQVERVWTTSDWITTHSPVSVARTLPPDP